MMEAAPEPVDIVVDAAGRDDPPMLARLRLASCGETGTTAEPDAIRRAHAAIETAIRDPSLAVLVARVDAAPAGFALLDITRSELREFAIDPCWYGRGVAPALMAELKRRSPAGIRLTVPRDKARAIWFFTREGFVPHPEAPGAAAIRMTWRTEHAARQASANWSAARRA